MKIEKTLEIPITITVEETAPKTQFHTRKIRKRSKHNDYSRNYYRKHRDKILRRYKEQKQLTPDSTLSQIAVQQTSS